MAVGSHPSPKRKREEFATHSNKATRIPLLALRAWTKPLPCKPEAQARGIRDPARKATRIPLLALRAWMKPLPCKPEAQARGIRDPARKATRIPLLALRAWMKSGLG